MNKLNDGGIVNLPDDFRIGDGTCEYTIPRIEVEGKLNQQAYDLIVPKYRKVTIDISPETMEEFRKEKPNPPIEININDYKLVGNVKRRDYKHNRLHILAEVQND